MTYAAYSLMQSHVLQEPAHAIRTLDEVECISVEAGALHLNRERKISDEHRTLTETADLFCGHGRGWRWPRLVSIPSMDTGRPTDCVGCINEQSVQQRVVLFTLRNEGLQREL